MATSAALLQVQITTLRKANEALHVRRKRTRKALVLDKALSVGEVQAIVAQEEVEAEIMEEMPKPKRRPPTCSRCHTQGHNLTQCKGQG